jgi:N6-L-threonylcarbamoyladenine synthase
MIESVKPFGLPLFVPDFAYTTDNAAMIAAAGYFSYLKNKPKKDSWKKIEINANLRL